MTFLSYFFAVIMIVSGIAHFAVPSVYEPLIPDWFWKDAANYTVAVIELLIGILLISKKTRAIGGMGFMLLMIGFLPLHIWDVTRENPMVQPVAAGYIRIVIQFALIYLGFRIWKKKKSVT